ncbi:hypothetical protein [Nocardia sp. CC227C]|uniref:hypothetical protein n=1 Tax=Nocardia sp. CC227C TaxID=3044562 RepID=UPI00278BEA51|nr:hypothetical protein [Nocardia sp. CC227C]
MLTEAVGERIWVIGCHYTIGLTRRNDTWLLSSSRVRISYEEGGRELEATARQRVTAAA